jgi:hypothetical protein
LKDNVHDGQEHGFSLRKGRYFAHIELTHLSGEGSGQGRVQVSRSAAFRLYAIVESGVPLPVVASLLGWSAGTVRMARRYGHISAEAQRRAVAHLQEAGGSENSNQENGQSDVPQTTPQ